MKARKISDLPLLYSHLDVMCSVWRRGPYVQYTCIEGEGGQTSEAERQSVDLGWRPDQLSWSGPVGLIFTMMGAGKGNPCCLT